MSRIWKIGSLIVMLGALATPSLAETDKPLAAGNKGTVSAWEVATGQLLVVKQCPALGSSWDYLACGRALREELTRELCAAKGPGTHKYLYQVGDGKRNPSSVYCKK